MGGGVDLVALLFGGAVGRAAGRRGDEGEGQKGEGWGQGEGREAGWRSWGGETVAAEKIRRAVAPWVRSEEEDRGRKLGVVLQIRKKLGGFLKTKFSHCSRFQMKKSST